MTCWWNRPVQAPYFTSRDRIDLVGLRGSSRDTWWKWLRSSPVIYPPETQWCRTGGNVQITNNLEAVYSVFFLCCVYFGFLPPNPGATGIGYKGLFPVRVRIGIHRFLYQWGHLVLKCWTSDQNSGDVSVQNELPPRRTRVLFLISSNFGSVSLRFLLHHNVTQDVPLRAKSFNI